MQRFRERRRVMAEILDDRQSRPVEQHLLPAPDAAESRQRVASERRAVQTWAAATEAIADERARLEANVRAFDDALDRSQPDRTVVATTEPMFEVRRLLEASSLTASPAWQHARRGAERMSSVEQSPPTPDLGLEL
jgi:hypothetical protein